MLKNNFGKIILLLAVFFLLGTLTINAQPPKKRGVGVQPKPTAAPTATPQSVPPPVNNTAPKKKTIVVLDFQDNTLGNESQKRNWGRQIAVLLSTKFSQQGNFFVIEQQEKEQAIIKMQNDSFKEGKNRSYQARIGQLVSANIVVFGDILEYTTKKGGTTVMGVGQAKFSAKVRLAVRLVDVNTGISLDAATTEGSANVKATSAGIFGKDTELNEDLKTALFTDAVNMATQNAVGELIKLIEQPVIQPISSQSPAISTQTGGGGGSSTNSNNSPPKPTEGKNGSKWNPFTKKKNKSKEETPVIAGNTTTPVSAPPISSAPVNAPYIAAVEGSKVYVRSLPAGTKVGTRLVAYKLGKATIDKKTGETISQEEMTIGELEVISISEKSFICKIITGSGLTEESLIKIVK